MRHITIIGIAILASLLASCQRSGQPAPVPTGDRPPATEASKRDAGPVIEIRAQQELDFEPGIRLTVWDLRASRVQQLTAKLLVIKDGKSEVAQELVCKWDNWPESKPEAAWRLYYLLQDGEPFGAKNKRLPTITLTFADAAPSSTAKKRSTQFLEGEFRIRHSESRKDNTLDQARAEVIYYGFYDPAKGDTSVTLGSSVEALVEASKGGRTAVAIVVEWKPVG
jgi:hypothetical protein